MIPNSETLFQMNLTPREARLIAEHIIEATQDANWGDNDVGLEVEADEIIVWIGRHAHPIERGG